MDADSRMNLEYSAKNIPHSKPIPYKKRLIEKTEKFIKNMRWRAFFFLHPEASKDNKETYGFNSRKTPPPIPELREFEDKISEMIQSVKFVDQPTCSRFQKKLRRDIRIITKDPNTIVSVDKTANFYKLKPAEYQELLDKNIHKNYKTTSRSTTRSIINEEKKIARSIDLADRIETIAEKTPLSH